MAPATPEAGTEDPDDDGLQSTHRTRPPVASQVTLDDTTRRLLQCFVENPSILEKSKDARSNRNRDVLMKDIGWTHEQVEGWYSMFQRDVRIPHHRYASHL
jgi:hypothetical protein